MSGWPWNKPKPPVVTPPAPWPPIAGGTFHQGVACGNPMPDARIADALAMNFVLFRTGIKDATQVSFDQFAKYPVVPLWIIGVYGNTAAGIQRTIAQIRKLTMPSRIELGNELNIGDAPAGMPKMSPADYAVVANATRAEIESRGHTCYYGAVSNLNPDGQRWLAEMLVKAPWITRVSVHRYPYQGQDPSKSPYGSRAAEMTALCTMLGGRRVLVTETGIMCPPVDEATQLASLKQEVGYWRAEPSCDGVVIWVEGGAPQESFGLREGTDGRWRLAGSVFGGAQTQTPTMRAVAVIVYNDASEGIAGAAVSLMTERDAAGDPIWLAGTTDATGILTLTEVPASLSDTQLRVEAEGYVTFDEHLVLDSTNQQIRMGMGPDPAQPNAILLPALNSAHFDPSTLTLHDLMRVRGGMWVNRAAIPYGPRGIPQTPTNQPDNINAMDYYEHYGSEDRALMRANYAAAGYTHAVTGPMIDTSGYHGHYPTYAGPLTQDWWDHYLGCMEEWWDNTDADGNPHPIIPVHFAVTDAPGVNIDDNMAMLEPFFLQERAQRVLRFLVLAWEPSPWTNADYVKVATWLRSVFPNAVIAVHLEPDHNAPGLSAEIADGSLTEAQMWANLAPHIHAFFPQTGNLLNNDPSDDEDFYEMFDPSVEGSWDHRFLQGYHGWPTFSANPDHGIWTIPSEYKSYKDYWQNEPESVARAVGDELMRRGAHGYFDGGSVIVP